MFYSTMTTTADIIFRLYPCIDVLKVYKVCTYILQKRRLKVRALHKYRYGPFVLLIKLFPKLLGLVLCELLLVLPVL